MLIHRYVGFDRTGTGNLSPGIKVRGGPSEEFGCLKYQTLGETLLDFGSITAIFII